MRSRKNRGFTLLEFLIAMAIALVLVSVATLSYIPIWKQHRVTNAYNSTLATLRWAHDKAAADMRTYVVTFTLPGTITVTQAPPANTLLVTTVLTSDVTFHVEPGVPASPNVPPTTPDGLGSAAFPIDFDEPGVGGGTVIYFYPDGTAEDVAGNINNGVVYLGRVGDLYSSRAITLWGSTGRIRGWRLNNVGGVATWGKQ
jgi:prepilin-type N-terminal cleavage/methylation domain-containing protein